MINKVAQIWYTDTQGNEKPLSNKFYSKVGTAESLAKKYSAEATPYKYFVRGYLIEFIGDIR